MHIFILMFQLSIKQQGEAELVEQLYAQYRQQWKHSCEAAKREKTLINPFEIQLDPV